MSYEMSGGGVSVAALEPRLRSGERSLLGFVAVASGVVALIALFAPETASALLGLSGAGNTYIYRMGGAAGLGYAVALGLGIGSNHWRALRIPVVAAFIYALASAYASAIALIGGNSMPALIAGGSLSVVMTLILGSILYSHRATPLPDTQPDVATWVVRLVQLATVLALVFGILPSFAPGFFSFLFGRAGTDALVAGLAAAACLGYGVMGILELRSLRWAEMRLPTLMAAIFNGISLVASILAIAAGDPGWLAYPVLGATLIVTGGSVAALRRNGR